MNCRLNLTLTDELRAFIDQHSGEGTPYATSDEFVRDVLREKKERLETEQVRAAILAGLQDAIDGRTVAYRGGLRRLIRTAAE